MVSPISTDAVGFAPLAPPTVWQGWDAFVHRAPAPARDATDPAWSQVEREDYHSELAVMRTPAMDSVFTAVRRLLLVNRRQQAGARRGLIISGPATTGKATTMMALGRSFQLADTRQHPGQAERRPVLFISVPPAATPKMLVSEFARFLGMPITDRLNQTQITGAVCDLLCELDTQRRAGAETSDQLKYLGERIPATFVYSAIDIETSSLLSGVRGAQIAGRFKIFRHHPLAYATEQDRAVWDDLVWAMENLLRLRAHRTGTLVKHAAYLHARTAGRIGSLSHLIREAALIAITEGTERITKQLLNEVELEAAAETQARPARRK
ncbi:TniB family NTP-binding protein [Streptomyces sp. DR7-3]|uniref:TniB family NTP-binding protein n=1 Tax=Streptomyces malaysiensis TaxID=92644 RepID=UPI0020435089|nr:TniB family NTP-binding protein [Streptomyces sp. DR7-3]MCM3810906.1 TniB family NTP-binding protein [Streptomyces sp. DR7-3]